MFPKFNLQSLSYRRVLLTMLSAGLMSLSFHPLGLHFCAWIGLIPLLFAIDNITPSATLKSGILFGFFFTLLSMFWLVFLQIETNIKILMVFGIILMSLYIGLYFGVGLLISKHIGIWSLPFVFAGFEFIKGLGELGFPWLSFGYSQARYPIIIQQAAIYGVYGLTFWLVLLNISLFRLLKAKQAKYLIITSVVIILPLFYGALRMKQPIGQTIPIGIVQPNIDPNLKFTRAMQVKTFNRLLTLSEQCDNQAMSEFGEPTALIIWPETAVPIFLKSSDTHITLISELSHRLNTPIFTGTPLYDHTVREVYNGAILIEPEKKIKQEYKKLHLVPFGEHIPFDRYIPFFRKIDLGEGDYSPGSEYTVFKTKKLTFSCLICFESIFPELSREFVARGAQLLVNITNDGWFGKISGPQQHNDMAILRTVENGVFLARSANTGISMIVDSYGRVLQETQLFEKDFIVCSISIIPVKTVYQSIGDILPLLSLIALPLLLIHKFFIANRHR